MFFKKLLQPRKKTKTTTTTGAVVSAGSGDVCLVISIEPTTGVGWLNEANRSDFLRVSKPPNQKHPHPYAYPGAMNPANLPQGGIHLTASLASLSGAGQGIKRGTLFRRVFWGGKIPRNMEQLSTKIQVSTNHESHSKTKFRHHWEKVHRWMGGYVVLLDKVYQLNKSNGSFSCWFILLGNPLQKQKYHMKRCQRLLHLAQLPTLTTNSSTENLKDVPKNNCCSFHQPFQCKPPGWVTLATWEVTKVLGMLIPNKRIRKGHFGEPQSHIAILFRLESFTPGRRSM